MLGSVDPFDTSGTFEDLRNLEMLFRVDRVLDGCDSFLPTSNLPGSLRIMAMTYLSTGPRCNLWDRGTGLEGVPGSSY